MTAPTINGTRYPQPIEELLPAARALELREGERAPSRNRLMREFRIGAPKADALRARLVEEGIRRDLEETFGYTPPTSEPDGDRTPVPPMADEPFGPDPILLLDVFGPDEADPVDSDPDPVDSDPDLVDESDTDTRTPKSSKRPFKRCLRWLRRQVRKPKVTGSEGAADPVDDQPDTQVRIDASERQSVPVENVSPQVEDAGHPDTKITRRPAVWPVVVLALPAFIAVWSGWVGLGEMCGFGMVDLLPGFTNGNGGPLVELNTAITLPIGMETYGTYALYVWLSGRVPARARRFAMWSAMVSLAVGSLGQVVYHLLTAAGQTAAPWQITTAVACLPVAVLGMGAALAHLVRE